MLKPRKKKLFINTLLSSLVITSTIFCTTIQANAFTLRGLKVSNYAKQFLGKPYVYGGDGPNSFDCSGLTSYSYKHALGIDIGRTTYVQINAGTSVSKNNLQPGDLFFTSSGHTSIYIGNGQIIQAPQTGDVVKISPISKYNFYGARRILQENDSIEDITFNPSFYASRYIDLKNAFGTNEISLGNHFLDCGIKEGRQASEMFDISYYLNHNSDLKSAFGNDYGAAYNHFLSYGYKENRDLSPVFNMKYYLEHNPDVKNAYGSNYLGVLNHFLVCGMKEGRQASENFNINVYKSRYSDLSNAFGNDNKAYYDHFMIYGLNEGRNAK